MNAPEPSIRRRIFTGSLKYVLARSTTGALGILASLLLYRFLGPEESGKLQLVLALAMGLGNIGSLGYLDTLARFVPEKQPDEGAGLFRRALRDNAVAMAVGGVVFLILLVFHVDLPQELVDVAPLFFLATTSYALYATSIGMLRGHGRLLVIPQLDLVFNTGAKLLALGVAVVAPFLVPVYAVHTAVGVGVLVWVLYLLRKDLRHGHARFSREEARFAKLIMVSQIVRMLVVNVDIYVLRYLMGPEEVGLYAAGTRITRVGEQLILGPLMVPLLYYFSHPESSFMRKKIMEQGTRLSGVTVGFAALVVTFLAKPIVNLFLGPEYLASIPITQVYVIYALGRGIMFFMIPMYNSMNRPDYGIYQGLAIFVVNLVLDFLLIPRYGALGAAVSGVIAISLTTLAASAFIRRRFGIRMWGAVARIYALYAVCFFLGEKGHPVVGLVVFVAALAPLRLMGPDELRWLKRMRRA